jgi:hypothetical protein
MNHLLWISQYSSIVNMAIDHWSMILVEYYFVAGVEILLDYWCVEIEIMWVFEVIACIIASFAWIEGSKGFITMDKIASMDSFLVDSGNLYVRIKK